jgi:ABC-type transporter MlaC component
MVLSAAGLYKSFMNRAIHLRKTMIYLCVAGALAVAPLLAHAQAPIDAFVAKVTEGISNIHAQAGGDAAKTLAGCGDFLGQVLNLPTMAKTAARDGWEQMSAEQRDAYEKAFAQRLAGECARELAKYNGEPITLAGVRNMGGDKLATFRLGAPENARMIAWQLRGTNDALAAVDVIFEGHSAMIKAHDDFLTVLRANKGNIDAVIESLRK